MDRRAFRIEKRADLLLHCGLMSRQWGELQIVVQSPTRINIQYFEAEELSKPLLYLKMQDLPTVTLRLLESLMGCDIKNLGKLRHKLNLRICQD